MLTLKEYVFTVCGKTVHCKLTTSELDGCDSMGYTTYGACFIGEHGEDIYRCKDLSTNKDMVERYIDTCMHKDVAPVHFRDILEDMLD